MVAWPQRGGPTDQRRQRDQRARLAAAALRDARKDADGRTDDDLAEFDDLAPTVPSMPSIPRVPRVPRVPRIAPPAAPPAVAPAISGVTLQVAADFAEYMLARNWLGAPHRLARLTLAERVRLIALVEQVYLPALALASRPDPRACMAAYPADDETG